MQKLLLGLFGGLGHKGKLIGIAVLSILALSVFALTRFGTVETTRKVNTFLQQNGIGEIKGGSIEEINRQLYYALDDAHFATANDPGEEGVIRIAEFIVENGLYGTATESLIKPPRFALQPLLTFIVLKTDAIQEKSPEAIRFLNAFYQRIKENDYAEYLDAYFSFFMLYRESPDVIEKLNYGHSIKCWEKPSDAVIIAVLQSSEEFKKQIISQLEIRQGFPSSIAEVLLKDFKPSNPQDGKYLYVFDNSEHLLFHSRADYTKFFVETRDCYKEDNLKYRTGILQPASNFGEAKYIISETYKYEGPEWYTATRVYLRHVNVTVVNVATGEKIFDKTYTSKWQKSYMVNTLFEKEYKIGIDFDVKECAKQIVELIEKGL